MKLVLKSVRAFAEIVLVTIAFIITVAFSLFFGITSLSWIQRQIHIHQALPQVRDRFNAVASLPETTLLSEHLGWAVCGNSDGSSAVYTRLYLSKLTRSVIESQFSPTGQIRVYFIDSSPSRISPKSEPCFYYVLFEGHRIPPASSLSKSEMLFIVYGFADEVDESIHK